MSLAEKVYMGLALYAILCTTINLYAIIYKINLDNIRRKKDEARRSQRRIARENERREELAYIKEIKNLYYDLLIK